MNRLKQMRICALILFLILSARVYYLTNAGGEVFARRAVMQQSAKVALSNGRGNIYDKNMQSFTAAGKKKAALIVKSDDADADFSLCKLLDKRHAYALYNRLYKQKTVLTQVDWDFNEGLIKGFKNVCITEDTKRYPDSGAGAAVIGYLSDGEGVSGAEKAFNSLLKNGDSYFLHVTKDATGALLPGFSFQKEINPTGMLLKTTLDKTYTEICQNALKDVNGSAVLIEIPSFDLLAMASSPTFNQNKIEEVLQDNRKPLLNRAVARYDMGSVFKIVVLSAALESGSVSLDDTFVCTGEKTVGNIHFLCRNHRNIEKLTVCDAFVYSCNSVFIDIGLKTGYNNIIAMAKRFGLNEKLIYPDSFPQSTGYLPDENNYYLADAANLSIGQGKLLGTAVHAAVFSAVVASDGVRRTVNLGDSLLNPSFEKKVDLRKNEEIKVIHPNTAKVIKDMMIETVKNGTGKAAALDSVQCAGKTGSAQTGSITDGTECVHGWFTGFFPADNPKYALCVFVENGQSGAGSAAPIFKKIAQQICISEGWET